MSRPKYRTEINQNCTRMFVIILSGLVLKISKNICHCSKLFGIENLQNQLIKKQVMWYNLKQIVCMFPKTISNTITLNYFVVVALTVRICKRVSV